MSKMHFCDQYTEEWWALRRGIPTASMFHKIVTPGGKPSAQARSYMYWLIAERLLGDLGEDKYRAHPDIEHGVTYEAEAIKTFSKSHKLALKSVGFVTTDNGRLGASPDCLVQGSVESVEIKCPKPWTQIQYLLDGPGNDYRPQVQGQLLVGDFQVNHFYAYHPNMPSYYKYTVRDEPYLRIMIELLGEFTEELEHETKRAKDMGEYRWLDEAMTKEPEFQRRKPKG
jgi:hypothetical protein